MILDTIVARKKEEVAELKRKGIQLPEAFAEFSPAPRGFREAIIKHKGVSVIAEVKKASPSKGVISENFQPVELALNYEKNNAQAISVLTDADFFQGSLLYLMQVRGSVSLPVLRKDFMIDPLQIVEAFQCGADAILLIAAILDIPQMKDFKAQATEMGMDVLVEVHDEHEAEMALEAGADLIGVNNRNLKDFTVDIETTFRLQKCIPESIPLISESGLKTADDFRRLRDSGVAGALIGETLMRAGAASDLLSQLRL